MRRRLKNTIIILIIMAALSGHANACTFVNLPINPVSLEKLNTFQGNSEKIVVTFNNEKTEGNIDVFPDSPMIITHKPTNTTCSIDGGVWARKDIYLSDDGSVILAHEFSGSNDFLNFYATKNCQKIDEIDISNSKWVLERNAILVSKQHRKTKPNVYPLAKYCSPKS